MAIPNGPDSQPQDREKLMQAIFSYIQAETLDEHKRIIEAHPELLGDEADSLMEQLEQAAIELGYESAHGDAIKFHRIFLRRCRETSVEQEFAEMDACGDALAIPSQFYDDLELIENSFRNYSITGDLAALDDTVAAWEHILNHPDFPQADRSFISEARNDAGSMYLQRYKVQGDIPDLSRALGLWQQAVAATPEDNPNFPKYLNSLGLGLRDLYKRLGRIEDLKEAIRICRQAVASTAEVHKDLPYYLYNLGNCIRDLYERLGRIEDLEEAIRVSRQAVAGTSKGQTDLPMYLTNLGLGLLNHYERLGRIEDLEEAIRVSRLAVAATPEDHPHLPYYLNCLGIGLSYLYERLGRIEDLEEAIGFFRQAVAVAPECDLNLPGYLTNLGNGLKNLYKRLDHIKDLEEAIGFFRRAVAAVPEGNTDLPLHLTTLGNGLINLYEHLGHIEDLEEAIGFFRRAVAAAPEGHTNLPNYLNSLGIGLSNLYQLLDRVEDLEEAKWSYRQACDLGLRRAPGETVHAAHNWQLWAFLRGSWAEVIEAYSFIERGMELRLTGQFSRMDKSFSLQDVQGLAAQAAYAYLQLDQPGRAVESLEAGRAQLLREALERQRRDLYRLQELGFKDLQDKFMEASERYDTLMAQAHSEIRPVDWAVQVEGAIREMHSAAESIRKNAGEKHPEYRFFLKSLPLEEIQKQAKEVPLIYLAVTSFGGMALIVNVTSLKVIELPELCDAALQKTVLGPDDATQLGGYLGAYEKWRNNSCDLSAFAAFRMALEETTRWLWDTIMGKVLAYLEAEGIREAVLIPTGLLCLMPLHAAWTEDQSRPTGRRYALDDFTFTYAPSAQALYHARQGARRPADTLLAVENPDGTLRLAEHEVKAVLDHFLEKSTHLLRGQASKNAVVRAIEVSQVLHFSTHGIAGWQEAESSRLKLADGNLTLTELFGLHLNQARLAVLSACETGVPGTKLPDEVVSLPSALMQAGVPGVVGSLWSVADISTAMLMAQFYDLWRDEHLSPPEALRQAQIWLRDSTVEGLNRTLEGSMEPQGFRMSAEAAGSLYGYIGLEYPKDRLFEHPFYWAAFMYTGL